MGNASTCSVVDEGIDRSSKVFDLGCEPDRSRVCVVVRSVHHTKLDPTSQGEIDARKVLLGDRDWAEDRV